MKYTHIPALAATTLGRAGRTLHSPRFTSGLVRGSLTRRYETIATSNSWALAGVLVTDGAGFGASKMNRALATGA